MNMILRYALPLLAALFLSGCGKFILRPELTKTAPGMSTEFASAISGKQMFGAADTTGAWGYNPLSLRNNSLQLCYKDYSTYIELKPFCDDPDRWHVIQAAVFWGGNQAMMRQRIAVPASENIKLQDMVEWIEPEYDENGRAKTPRKFVRVVSRGFTETCNAKGWHGFMPVGDGTMAFGWVKCEGWSAEPYLEVSRSIDHRIGWLDTDRRASAPPYEVRERLLRYMRLLKIPEIPAEVLNIDDTNN